MLVSRSPTVVGSVRRHRRAARLASTERAGVQSRRLIRQRHQRLVRERWYVFAGIIVVGGVVCLAVKLLVWEPLDAYLIGAIAASTVWACHSIVTSVDGLASRRVGVLGEEWTVSELRKLRKHGWRFVNHVMLEHGDIDHAVLGPAGFFSVDSKYRSDWSKAQSELARLADDAQTQARKLQSRLQVKTPKVKPVVAMWGPELADTYEGPFERDGVLFCPGKRLTEQLRAMPTSTDNSTIESAYSTLDRYVERRDTGEQEKFGEPVRSIGDHFNDVAFAALAMVGSLLLVVLPASAPPIGLWSIATAVAIVSGSIIIRRRLDSSPRAQRVTTASITTSAGTGLILLAALIVDAFR